MKLIENTRAGMRYLHWSFPRTCAYFIKGVARELGIAPGFFDRRYRKVVSSELKRRWLRRVGGESWFEFNGMKLPDVSGSPEKLCGLAYVLNDVFLFPCYYGDLYDKALVEKIDRYNMMEGPYGYVDEPFDVRVQKGDIVIDAGAWIGDFSAYVVARGATVHAFEPVEETFRLLCKTRELNGNTILPVRAGLGSKEQEVDIAINASNSGANTMIGEHGAGRYERVRITTLDKYVEEQGLERVDFIKADIEGAEREMLKGAVNVLRRFAPKLSICTYHLPDDPVVLEQIIREANPDYTVKHLRNKLFAAVVKHDLP
ncbi:MAG: FkbM family methyltransferase [Odoribacteraceae bacterium]|jgi:FkbM family methyltransferase|nr:FkbM family methyltransferase [Odoribacteraceae bacterium]